jgi:hypothetical protein
MISKSRKRLEKLSCLDVLSSLAEDEHSEKVVIEKKKKETEVP